MKNLFLWNDDSIDDVNVAVVVIVVVDVVDVTVGTTVVFLILMANRVYAFSQFVERKRQFFIPLENVVHLCLSSSEGPI